MPIHTENIHCCPMQTVDRRMLLQHLTRKKGVHSFYIHKSDIIPTNLCDFF